MFLRKNIVCVNRWKPRSDRLGAVGDETKLTSPGGGRVEVPSRFSFLSCSVKLTGSINIHCPVINDHVTQQEKKSRGKKRKKKKRRATIQREDVWGAAAASIICLSGRVFESCLWQSKEQPLRPTRRPPLPSYLPWLPWPGGAR